MEKGELEALKKRFIDAGQGHIFRYWDELSPESRQKFIHQLQSIDLDLLQTLVQKFVINPAAKQGRISLLPPKVISIPRTEEQKQRAKQAKLVGEKLLHSGKVAVVLVAGGQGTRLGFDGPKGIFPITPVRKKSLFQFHAEKILALRRRYQVPIPWYIMTSESNDAATRQYFQDHDFFQLPPDDIFFFTQSMLPAVDEKGKLILDAKDHVFTSPNGHGGTLLALVESGALEDMKARGIEEIFYFQVDNVLIKICDPIFIGYHHQAGAEMSSKVVSKRDPEEKLGVIGYQNGKLTVIEYSDLSKEDMYARNPDGSLKYNAGSIAIHMIQVKFVEKELAKGFRLPYHVAHKKIPFLDESGKLIKPTQPNGYKFETFIFDALRDTTTSIIMEVKREEEFSPVKNATGEDSPATAQRDLCNLYGGWLEQIGVVVPRDSNGNVSIPVEISPLFALDVEELSQRITKPITFDTFLYLGP
ncbi:MAG TPA: UDPGP type 1 family protein [Bacteroidetes bacterium]|nr:UDPGP type 1 family protein [Bacteroidota bacterium]